MTCKQCFLSVPCLLLLPHLSSTLLCCVLFHFDQPVDDSFRVHLIPMLASKAPIKSLIIDFVADSTPVFILYGGCLHSLQLSSAAQFCAKITEIVHSSPLPFPERVLVGYHSQRPHRNRTQAAHDCRGHGPSDLASHAGHT